MGVEPKRRRPVGRVQVNLGMRRAVPARTTGRSLAELTALRALAIDYRDPASPVLAVRIQDVFGLLESPRIGRGRVPLTLHLLSPAHRPVQVTQDLASFWKETYFEVRKELKGRYPKHDWPDDPLTAIPGRHAGRDRSSKK